MGGLIIYHSFTLGQIFWSLKILVIFFGNQWEWTVYAGCQKKCVVQHPAHFRLFLKFPAEKLMPHFQFSFKSWLNNVDSELYTFLLNSMLWWLEKVSFQTAWAFLTKWRGRLNKEVDLALEGSVTNEATPSSFLQV